MLCDSCKERDSVVTLTRSSADGVVTEEHLCDRCAVARGIETHITQPKQPLADFINSLHQQLPASPHDGSRCGFCSGTLRDFRNTGRLGCPYCYATFEATLRDLLRRIHGNSKHLGKRYQPPPPLIEEGATVLAELRDRLRRAVEQEQFEEAARLRDQIKVLE
ncbi:MAG TPA: UvrB/UvrC motif-containing protein [Gemmatimonadaceae bacterium]|jgi:protein arginine kinase activator